MMTAVTTTTASPSIGRTQVRVTYPTCIVNYIDGVAAVEGKFLVIRTPGQEEEEIPLHKIDNWQVLPFEPLAWRWGKV